MYSEEQKEQERSVRELCDNIKTGHICTTGSREVEGIEVGPPKKNHLRK